MSTTDTIEATPTKRFTLGQRLSLWLIAAAGALAIRIIGCTLRFEFSAEDDSPSPRDLPEAGSVAPFWHRAVFSAAYLYRGRGVAVMTSRSFDGEYIARIISHFGFNPVRGSSSRGAVGALLGMMPYVERGGIAAFTIDGPRGPKYVAKPGPVLLAKKVGSGIRCFYIAVDRGWKLGSWDELVIPRPFARAHVRWSKRIMVPANANEAEMAAAHQEMQQALERITIGAEQLVGAKI